MVGVKVAILVAIGVLVAGTLGLVVIYPLIKTLGGWIEAGKVWARGKVMGPELGLTLADGGEKAKEKEEE